MPSFKRKPRPPPAKRKRGGNASEETSAEKA